jgi:hypothetical protein
MIQYSAEAGDLNHGIALAGEGARCGGSFTQVQASKSATVIDSFPLVELGDGEDSCPIPCHIRRFHL